MSFKYPQLPGSRADKEETADFWEIKAIENPGMFVSQLAISKIISKEFDELTHDGIESEDDLLENNLDDVFEELKRRVNYTAQKYPFCFTKYSIKYNENLDVIKDIYLYLLLCTRLNMKTQKIQNTIDGTLLFEKLCSYIAKKYFGDNAQSYVFGTATRGSFEKKVKELINKLGEGESFKNPNNNNPTKNDDSVDVVVWKEFSDKREGKLIGFGQCKTGTTSWRDDIHQLKPTGFCNNWFLEQPVFNPLPLVFITDTLYEDTNFITSQRGFLFFNRFRILEYVNNDIPKDLLGDVKKWVNGASNLLNIKN